MEKMEIVKVKNRDQLKDFIFFPAKNNANHKFWVPPIYRDEWKYFDLEKNGNLADRKKSLFLAVDNGRVVGRVQGVINYNNNGNDKRKLGRFGFFECINDKNVAEKILRHVEDWARENGMDYLMGPKGSSNLDPVGLVIEGFEHEPAMFTNANYPHIPEFLAEMGYEKYVDYVSYKIPVEIPELYQKIHKRISRRSDLKLHEFRKRSELKEYAFPVLSLMNECYRDLEGYVPLTENEMNTMATRYIPMLDPRFLKLITVDGRVVSFVIGIPNLNEGLRKARGRLFPFGFYHIMQAMNNSPKLDLLLGAIHPEYRGRGLDVLMGVAMYKSAIDYGFEYIDSHLELESNEKVQAEMKRVGGVKFKRHRVFIKKL